MRTTDDVSTSLPDLHTVTLPAMRSSSVNSLSQVVLKVHSRSDLACHHCHVYEAADQGWRGRPMVIPDDVAVQAARRIAEHGTAHSLPAVQVALHGGKPLLAGIGRLGRAHELADAVHAGFHLTSVEVGATGTIIAAVVAVYTIRRFYDGRQARRKIAQAKAARDAQNELSALKVVIADSDRELERLGKLRRENGISPSRELRLPRRSFAGDKRLAEAHQRQLRSFNDTCQGALDRIAGIDKLLLLAVEHDSHVFDPDVMQALVGAKSSFERIRKDGKIDFAEAEQLVASIKGAFPAEGSPGRPGEPVSP